jgi:hypothetical protein
MSCCTSDRIRLIGVLRERPRRILARDDDEELLIAPERGPELPSAHL